MRVALEFAAVHLADAEWRLGLWGEALLHAEAAIAAAADAAHGWFIAQAHAAATARHPRGMGRGRGARPRGS
jgi:hypothetical protein